MSVKNRWLDALDRIDPFYGDQAALNALLSTAPTPEDAAWLEGVIVDNERFKSSFFTDDFGLIGYIPFQETPEGERAILKHGLDNANFTIKRLRENQVFIAIAGAIIGFFVAQTTQIFAQKIPFPLF